MTLATAETVDTRIGLCLDCSYPLRDLPSPRCPECGREFDPHDPNTMNMGRELTPAARWLLGPIRWPVHLATWAAVAFALWSARLPGQQVRRSWGIFALASIGVIWLAWPIVRWLVAKWYGYQHSLLMRGRKQRFFAGLIVLLAVAAIWFHLPMKAAIWISRPAMDRMARELLNNPTGSTDDRWIGIYKARRILVTPSGVRFTVEDQDVTYRAGFEFFANVNPKKSRWYSYTHVGGGWWAWRRDGR